ncbi:MAG: antitoxin family protein [Chloroflexi bacterium]|nr:antitoxin family protein [Chloroflexota bacterium]
MSTTINARFADGVFTPLEHIAFPEGTIVVLSIETEPAKTPSDPSPVDQVAPHNGKFLPGMEDPQKIKQLLLEEDVEHYINSSKKGGSI